MGFLTVFEGGVGNDTLNGTTGADVLMGYDGNDRLNGGDGDDILNPGAGTNQVDAGAGNDIILIDGTATGDYRVPANGILGGAGFDTVVFDGPSTNYHITQVVGGTLTVVNLTTGSRDMMLEVEQLRFSDTTITLAPGGDARLIGSFAADTLTGTDADEALYGLGGNDSITAGGGNDTIDAGAGTNRIDAGAGDDTILIDGSASNGLMMTPANGLAAGDGYDTVVYSGAVSDYRITQTSGGPLTVVNLTNGSRDMMTGVEALQFADTEIVLVPRNANAPVVSGPVTAAATEGDAPVSFDALAMAADADGDALTVVDLPALPEGVTFDAASQSFTLDPTATVFDALNDGETAVLTVDYGISDGVHVTAAQAVFTLAGQTDRNPIIGTAQNDRLQGTLAADDMQGLGGNDSLNGGAGNDLLDGGLGKDSLNGGDGDDRVVYDAADAQAKGGLGTDTLVVSTGVRVNLGASDQVTGDAGATGGFENVDAGAALVSVTLRGSAADNHLTGGNADDRLQGGRGADVLTGGAGADLFIFAAAESTAAAADQITDFTAGVDHLDLTAIDAISGGANNAFTFIGDAALTAAGQLRHDQISGLVEADMTGDGLADFQLWLVPGTAMGAGDILL